MVSLSQAIYADPYGIVLKGSDGKPIQDIFVKISNLNTINKEKSLIGQVNSTSIKNDPLGVASAIADLSWTLLELVFGIYVFDILFHLLPQSIGMTIFIAGLVAIYLLLLARSILGWIKGVF